MQPFKPNKKKGEKRGEECVGKGGSYVWRSDIFRGAKFDLLIDMLRYHGANPKDSVLRDASRSRGLQWLGGRMFGSAGA